MRIFFALILVLLLAGFGWAASNFQDSGSQDGITSVVKAKDAKDDTPVVLTGFIVRRADGDHEYYIFRDSTDEMLVEIDDDLFMGRKVTPKTPIRIYGEVDKEINKTTKIDVKSFKILQ